MNYRAEPRRRGVIPDGGGEMATSVRVRRRTGGISLLLSGLLVAGAPTSAWAQPDQVPDPGARPAPVGEVRLPDGTSARIPSDPDPMAGPLAGQIAAVESGLAVAALTQCSAPEHLRILGREEGLGPLEPMEVAVYRSRDSRGSKAVDSLHSLLVKTLRQSASV